MGKSVSLLKNEVYFDKMKKKRRKKGVAEKKNLDRMRSRKTCTKFNITN